MIFLPAILLLASPQKPIEFGQAELNVAAGAKATDITLKIKAGGAPESYTITPSGAKVTITGADQRGAMYGAFEFAERLRNNGASAWKTKASGKPFLAERGLNLFLTLPWDYKRNDTDYDPAALTDPDRWWFHNEDYWKTLLDLMAKSRLNWLDIHGAWDISVTNAPNLYAYFVTSPTFPLVGTTEDTKAKNLKQLNHVIEMAHARGIKVSLMAYEANLKIPQNPNPPYEASEANIYKYTKEVVEQMIRRSPKLDALGYRIGESGKGESFFHCYGEAVKASGRDIPLYTRSWITRRANVLPLARASKDFTVEIKYNGEQWGAPYMVAGGRMASWYSYSFEDYLSDSAGIPGGAAAKLWPGNLVGEGEPQAMRGSRGQRWPSNPYKIVWQVRANGTHRIFPFFNPEMVRSTIKTMKIGTATGYTIEGEDAYYPKSPDYYLANPADKYCNWIHQRDEMYWMTWGRLGYDPSVKFEVFLNHMKKWFGNQAPKVGLMSTASSQIANIFNAHSLGPDHRNHSPEMELMGGSDEFIQGEPFDSLTYCSAREFALMRTLGLSDGRFSPADVAVALDPNPFTEYVQADFSTEEFSAVSMARYKELAMARKMAEHLATYVSQRMRAAIGLAEQERVTGKLVAGDYSRDHMRQSLRAWEQMSTSPEAQFYRPFTERLRMRTNTYHWNTLLPTLERYNAEVQAMAPSNARTEWQPRFLSSPDNVLTWRWVNGRIKCTVLASGLKSAALLYKPLPSSTFFHRVRMTRVGKSFEAQLPPSQWGYCLAAEVRTTKGVTSRIPGVGSHSPYLIVPALPGPTPQIYSAEEAMTFLDPAVLDPRRYGTLLMAPRAWRSFNGFDNATKRKVFGPVELGMKLVIMQQDYVSGRYKLDWLPKPLAVENNPQPNLFDPAGAMGLKRIETDSVLWQRFKPSEGWEVFGNGGLARMKLGKGEIWMINARLMQRMTNANCARALKTLMTFCAAGNDVYSVHGGPLIQKPVVLIDAGTEDAALSTSFFPDFMNMLDIPFLTLGEVIANEQGMNSFKPIPGPIKADDVLQGQGSANATRALRNQVIEASKRATPATLAAFETERTRRKRELMRSLGLDPMPPRTPLNARETGRIKRDGYRIEKVVIESRPQFYVTAHVYVPAHPPTKKLPVIVNVNGHWAHKKNEDRIQLRAAFQALQGYIAIAVDSPGWSFEGDSLIERRLEGTHNDWTLVQGGTNTTGYYVWDCIRALDYMATRNDTDMTKIGITGASGGGLATLYTFAADDRYTAAVPVVYMASMELAPDNGCLCNHVPGTCQIGDRSDVLAIQAPKPVFIMGAQNDGEFPPEATLLTVMKATHTWKLFGKPGAVEGRIFSGPHDYNQLMREQMIGFFNKALKGEGDGSPVPQPVIEAIPPEDRQLLVLDPPAIDERTMRDLAMESLRASTSEVSIDEALYVNGGRKPLVEPKLTIQAANGQEFRTYELEGIKIPGIYKRWNNIPGQLLHKTLRIEVTDLGKSSVVLTGQRVDRLVLDPLGIGELANIEMRFPVYLGQSVPFIAGWQLACIAGWSRYKYVTLITDGPISGQAAMWAGMMGNFEYITVKNGLTSWEDVFKPGVSHLSIQPRANLLGPLPNLMKKVGNLTRVN